jgi:transposase
MMRGQRKPLHLIVDGLPAHRTLLVRAHVNKLKGKLTLHVLPGYAPDLNPDELTWSHAKRTGNARPPLPKGSASNNE